MKQSIINFSVRIALFLIIISMSLSCKNDLTQENERNRAFAHAQKLHDKEEYNEAVEIINRIIDADSLDNEARYFRARCNFFLENYGLSVKDLKIVANAGYRQYDANYNIGNIYWITAEYSNAVKYFKIALEFDPSNQEVKEIIEVLEEAVEIFETPKRIY